MSALARAAGTNVALTDGAEEELPKGANDMSTSIGSDIHKATTWSIVLSVLMSATGILALFMPALTGVTVTIVFGWLLIFSGILHFGYAWQAARPGTAIWEVLLGVVYGGVGFYTLVQPVAGLEALTLALVIYFIFEGVVEFVLSFFLRPLPGSGWLLFDGIVTLFFAVMVGSGWPASSTWVVGTLVAISMFFSGLTRLMVSLAVRNVTA